MQPQITKQSASGVLSLLNGVLLIAKNPDKESGNPDGTAEALITLSKTEYAGKGFSVVSKSSV